MAKTRKANRSDSGDQPDTIRITVEQAEALVQILEGLDALEMFLDAEPKEGVSPYQAALAIHVQLIRRLDLQGAEGRKSLWAVLSDRVQQASGP